MESRFSQAGGCFLALTILGGTALGIAGGNAMLGLLIGTVVGVAVAVLTWLLDRRR